MRNLWASFDFLVHFLIIFFIVQSFKNEILSKILDIQKYNIVRHWFSSKNWIFAIFFKKVSIDGFTHFYGKYYPKFSKNIFQSFKNDQFSNNQTIRSKILDIFWLFFLLSTKIQHCTTLIFLKIFNWRFLRFYARSNNFFSEKDSIDGFFFIFHFENTPQIFKKSTFQKSIYPNILYICDQNFMLVPTIKLLEFSDKNWETYFLSVFWLQKFVRHGPFFDYFFYCPKFQKWNFIKNPWYTKIQHCTTLIFLKKLDFCDFF